VVWRIATPGQPVFYTDGCPNFIPKKARKKRPEPLPLFFCHFIFQHLLVEFLAFQREGIKIYGHIGHQVYHSVYTTFRIQELIKHNHFFLFQQTIATLKVSPFVPHHIPAFGEYALQTFQSIGIHFHSGRLVYPAKLGARQGKIVHAFPQKSGLFIRFMGK